jgi:hypothetical protein
VSALALAPSVALAADVSAAASAAVNATAGASGNVAGQNDNRSGASSAAADVTGSASVGTTLGLGDLVTDLNGTGDDGTTLTAIGAANEKSTIIIVPVSSMAADASVGADALATAETHASGRLGSVRAAVHGSAVVEAALVAKGYRDSQIVGVRSDATVTTNNSQNNTGGTIWVYVDDRA